MSDPKVVLDAEDEMDAALAEMRAARSAPAEAAPAETVEQSEPAPAPAEPQPEAIQPEDPPAQAAADPAAAPKPEDDEALKAKRLEEQRIRSEEGRIRAYQQQVGERDRQIAELRKQLEGASKPPETQAEALQKLEALASQYQAFPELQEIARAARDAIKESAEHAKTTAKTVAAQAVEPFEAVRRQHLEQEQRQAAAAAQAATQALEASYPKQVIVDTVRSADFAAWLPTQPKLVQDAFHHGQTPQEAMVVMDAYDSHLKRAGRPGIARIPTPQPSAAAAPAVETRANAQDERLRRAAGVPSRSSARPAGLPAQDDFEGSLNHWREQRLRRAAA